ncbi:hypothetical protein ACTOV4_07275 [Brucella sp. C7-11G]
MSIGNGVSTTNVDRLTALDEVIGNSNERGSGRIPINDFAKQLVSVPILADQLAAASEGIIPRGTWNSLRTVPGDKDFQPGRVIGPDDGTHVDAVSGQNVPNEGEYRWSVSSNAWIWVSRTVQSQLDGLGQTTNDLSQADTAIENTFGSPFFGSDFVEGSVSEDGTALMAFNEYGEVSMVDTHPLLDPRFIYAEVNEAGEVLKGWEGGDKFFPNSVPELDADQRTYVDLNNEVILLKDMGNNDIRRVQLTEKTPATIMNTSPAIEGNFVSWFEDNGSVAVKRQQEILGASTHLATVKKLYVSAVYGQSLSAGSGSTPPIHVTAVRPGRALMFNGGPYPRGSTGPSFLLPHENLYSLEDMREISTLESPVVGLCWGLTEDTGVPADAAALVFGTGRGGQPYSVLKKNGSNSGIEYKNTLYGMLRSRIIAELNSLVCERISVHWIQGEADRLLAKAIRKLNMLEIQSDLSGDLGVNVVLILDQISNWTAYNLAHSDIPFADLEVALENPDKIICVGPKYMLETNSDGVHLPAAMSARLGCYHARAERNLINGRDTLPLHCTGYEKSGNTIILNMHVPVGPLTIDTIVVTDPGNHGISWSQSSGTARSIASVAVNESSIVVTFDGDVTAATGTLGIAALGISGADGGPTTGARSNFRDSATDLDIDGNVMPNWACHQLIQIS